MVQAATADLVALDFGLDALDAGERVQLFALLRKVRVAAGDFSALDPPQFPPLRPVCVTQAGFDVPKPAWLAETGLGGGKGRVVWEDG